MFYLFFAALAGPISDVVTGKTRAPWLAATALGAFVACFVLLIELARRPGVPAPSEPVTPARRQVSRALLAALFALAIGCTVGFGRSWPMLFLFVAIAMSFAIPIRWAPLAIAGVGGVAVAIEVVRWDLAAAGSWAVSIALSGFLALFMRRRALLIEELRAAQGEVARMAAADAVADERLRFARDLHDLLGHSLSVVVLKAELARRLLDGAGPRARVSVELGDLEQIARRALDEVREAVSGYRVRSLATELDRARAALEAAGVGVIIRVAHPALPRDLDDLLAWVVREAATNIVRHSRARRAEFALSEADGIARLDVCNDGVAEPGGSPGPGDASGGSGLVGLRERVAQAGGRLTAAPEREREFRVTAIVALGGPLGSSEAPAAPGSAHDEVAR